MKNLIKNFSFSDKIGQIKGFFFSSKKNIALFILILSVSFFSSLSIASGLNFSVSDTTSVNDAISFRDTEEKVANVENKVTAKLASVKTTSKATNYKYAYSAKQSAPSNNIKISGNTVALKATDCNTMPTPNYSSANYCHFQGSPNLFIYGHNTNNIFGKLKNLSIGSTFTITLNGQTGTYRITDKFSIKLSELNPDPDTKKANALRYNIYRGYYHGASDITIQTCHGVNDSERLYIKAVRI